MNTKLEELRERFAEVHAQGEATIETARRLLALVKERAEHDAGGAPHRDAAAALASAD